jgi:hypothetical protein
VRVSLLSKKSFGGRLKAQLDRIKGKSKAIYGLVAGVGLEKSGTYLVLKIGVYLLNTIFLRFRVCK